MQQRTLLRRVRLEGLLETAFEKVLSQVLSPLDRCLVSQALMGKRVLRRVTLRRGSKKGLSRRHLGKAESLQSTSYSGESTILIKACAVTGLTSPRF